MALVKVGISNMSDPDKIQFARQIVTQMTGNTNFTTPTPALVSITTAADDLETAYNDAQTAAAAAKTATSVQADKSEALDLLLMQEGNYVENASGGDQSKIESSGFDVRNVPAGPIGALPAPANVEVTPHDIPGTVNMVWEKVRGAKSYTVERAVDAPTLNWTTALNSTKTKTVVNTMVSGTKYWFRVSAIGAAGQGAASDPIAKYAP
jgi:hypothetical protein